MNNVPKQILPRIGDSFKAYTMTKQKGWIDNLNSASEMILCPYQKLVFILRKKWKSKIPLKNLFSEN